MVTIVACCLLLSRHFCLYPVLDSFHFFQFPLPVYQPDTEIVLSHQINAISIMVVGFLLNIISGTAF